MSGPAAISDGFIGRCRPELSADWLPCRAALFHRHHCDINSPSSSPTLIKDSELTRIYSNFNAIFFSFLFLTNYLQSQIEEWRTRVTRESGTDRTESSGRTPEGGQHHTAQLFSRRYAPSISQLLHH